MPFITDRSSPFAAMSLVTLLLTHSASAATLLPRGAEGADQMNSSLHISKTPAVIVLILYLVSTVVLWSHFFRNGRKGYMLSLTIGMTCMTLGFAIRLNPGAYAWQFLLTFLSPVAFLAQNYVLLSRLSFALTPAITDPCLLLPRRGLTWTFLMSDVVTFCCQTAGTVFVIIGGDFGRLGQILSVAGVALALLSYAAFTVILVVFVRRMKRFHPTIYSSPYGPRASLARFTSTSKVHDVKLLTNLMLITCVGILIRSLFRLIEQSDGFFGYLATHEAYFYALDAVPLWASMSLYVLLWPSKVIEACREGGGLELGDGKVGGREYEAQREEEGWGGGLQQRGDESGWY